MRYDEHEALKHIIDFHKQINRLFIKVGQAMVGHTTYVFHIKFIIR